MITKKYYRVFADLFRTSTDLADFKQLFETYLAIDNPRFDRVRFNKASKRDVPDYIEQAKIMASQHM